jgi:uncharacterized protein with ParB-like and HNH nuclease domain
MGYQTTTIAETLNRINKDLFIPAIQRPFVWLPDQITRLFDSLMRGYPIGGLMFWNLPQGSLEDWEIYYFIKYFRMGSIHNERADLHPDHPVTLVLDGQQRLTSLLIGLRGSYSVKQKNKSKTKDESWDEKVLYIDLCHSADQEEYDDDDDNDTSPIAEHYRFAFFDHDVPPRNKLGELWFEVGLILKAKSEAERDQMLKQWVSSNLNSDAASLSIATENFCRLWASVWHDQAITFFTESSNSYDRVLDIFIRANDGGTRLSHSDLLMSVITLRWEKFNAREETELLIDDLSKALDPKRAFTREFILRTALFLNDLDFSIKVKNFVPSNIRLLEKNWERTKTVLRFSAKFLRDHGLYGERLSGANVIMLVAYYVHKSNANDDDLVLSEEDQQRIRRWLILISFQGVLATQTRNTFMAYRNAIRRTLRDEQGFPLRALAEAFKNMGRPIDFTQDAVVRWCNTQLAHAQAESLLSLLYPDDLASLHRRALPLVQPCYFKPEEMRRSNVSDALAPVLQSFDQRLILGVALNNSEQEQYYALPFEQWTQTLSPTFLHTHCLPEDINLYRMDRLPEWVGERRKLLSQRLLAL